MLNEKALYELRARMVDCPQTEDMSVLMHGYSVHDYYQDLINHIQEGEPLKYEWKLPDWIHEEWVWHDHSKLSDETIKNYHIYHDCGKPDVLYYDEDGRKHFPDHAAASCKAWAAVGGSLEECELIYHDMDIHLLKADGVMKFAQNPHWATLLLTGLCEIHSNASMFGGIDSTSFKIKWKQIKKRGNAIIKHKINTNP